MKFSLIISTKGRVNEVIRLLESLNKQTLQDFEIIISDQNEDNRLIPVLKNQLFGDRLIHIRSHGGLSRGRNAGLEIAQGAIVTFPDDDCRYPEDLLQRVSDFFDHHGEFGMLSGRSFGDDGADSVSKHAKESGEIRKTTIYSQSIEFAFFVRRIALGVIRYDEHMGVGCSTPWQSDEGPDLILRLMEKGVRGFYDRKVSVWHPKPAAEITEKFIQRTYAYSCGSGYFLRKHRFPIHFIAILITRPAVGILLGAIFFNPNKIRLYAAKIRGRARGWYGYKKK